MIIINVLIILSHYYKEIIMSVNKNNKNSEQIASLGTRVSSLVDELHSVKKEIELFKKAVAADMKVVLNHVGRNN